MNGYKIVSAGSITKLEERVNDAIFEGLVVHGTIVIEPGYWTEDYEVETQYAQVMLSHTESMKANQ